MTEREITYLKKRGRFVLRELKKLHPEAQMILKYSNNWELLVAVALSAQCTDKQVNKVTDKLFKKYPKLEDYVNADLKEFEQDIYSTGFYKNKAKNVLAAAKVVTEDFGGKIPKTIKELITIPGVGRKTANVILGNAYGIVEGMAVDTHVGRLARVFGLTLHKDPKKIEKDLLAILPQQDWFDATYLMIDYGRAYCIAKKHDHDNCPMTKKLADFKRKHDTL